MNLEELYEEFEAALRGYAFSLAHDSHTAADLTQETFLRATANALLLEQLGRNQRRRWLYSTLKNIFFDQYRRSRMYDTILAQMRVSIESETAVLSVEDLSFLDGVPERDRDILIERFVHGSTSAEIASDLGIPAATVRSRIRITLNRVRNNPELYLQPEI